MRHSAKYNLQYPQGKAFRTPHGEWIYKKPIAQYNGIANIVTAK